MGRDSRSRSAPPRRKDSRGRSNGGGKGYDRSPITAYGFKCNFKCI